MCRVPIVCLRSYQPTDPRWLHAHLPIHYTGNQLPRQPQNPCACQDKFLFYIALAQQFMSHSFIQQFNATSLSATGLMLTFLVYSLKKDYWTWKLVQTVTEELIKLPDFCLHNVGHAQWNKTLIESLQIASTDTYNINSNYCVPFSTKAIYRYIYA